MIHPSSNPPRPISILHMIIVLGLLTGPFTNAIVALG
jgi:hypothetical protein